MRQQLSEANSSSNFLAVFANLAAKLRSGLHLLCNVGIACKGEEQDVEEVAEHGEIV